MDTLDLLIAKFKEFKEVLDNDTSEKTMAKNDTSSELEKALGDPSPNTGSAAGKPKHNITLSAPKFKGSDLKIIGRGRVAGPGLRMPPTAPKEFKKTINQSYEPEVGMAKEDVIKAAPNGQWSLEKITYFDQLKHKEFEEAQAAKDSKRFYGKDHGPKKLDGNGVADVSEPKPKPGNSLDNDSD